MRPYTTHPGTLTTVSTKKVIVIVSMLTMCSCSVTKTIPVETIKEVTKVDTIYLSNIQYDSIYVLQDRYIDRSHDTLYIRESNTEYHYKLLRDTIKEVRVDSIPYEVRITETIEVQRKLTWYDHATRTTFWLLIGFLFLWLYRKLHKP